MLKSFLWLLQWCVNVSSFILISALLSSGMFLIVPPPCILKCSSGLSS